MNTTKMRYFDALPLPIQAQGYREVAPDVRLCTLNKEQWAALDAQLAAWAERYRKSTTRHGDNFTDKPAAERRTILANLRRHKVEKAFKINPATFGEN